MQQEDANKLINTLGVILLLETPQGMQFGIDNTYWHTGSKFKGVKLIPLGVHYVFYAFKDEKFQFKLGFFANLTSQNVIILSKRVVIKRFNQEIGDFTNIEKDEFERYESGVKNFEFDSYLGCYQTEKIASWIECSNFISQSVLDKLDPIEKKIVNIQEEYNDKSKQEKKQTIYCEFEDDENQQEKDIKQKDYQNEEEQTQENFNVIYGTIYYTDIPKKLNPPGIFGQKLTMMNFDKTIIVENLLKKEYNNDYKILFGELQYAFATFLLGENLDSFEQWKKIFILLLSCDSLIQKQPQLFIDLIRNYFYQPQSIPNQSNFQKTFLLMQFLTIISHEKYLRQIFKKNFIQMQQQDNTNRQLQKRVVKLNQLLEQKFKFFIYLKEQISLFREEVSDDELPQIISDLNFIKLD